MLDSENFPFEESDRETSTSPGSSFSASSPLAGGILGEEELRTIPSYRIRRRRPNCVKITKIEITGQTMLCFPQDRSWFQGDISTDDDSSYSLFGNIIDPPPHRMDLQDKNNNKGEDVLDDFDDAGSSLLYRVALTDHFTGLSHRLPHLGVHLDMKTSTTIFNTGGADVQVDFTVEEICRGQKADIMLQRHSGSSSLVGKGCLVLSGPISLSFPDMTPNHTPSSSPASPNWSL
ncbi:uncharacterized protein LOC110858956 [Folsomia candida]|uniref:Uncharacterized protein n=1 Tax=Folsomia candida TaxID=158441 RepID=A0A226DC66_FOLCA|nr:uncharacterized protein LOC110858956 [Folsomia candida]OXA43102.1 hypothetical protein Fcan01_22211 [Folsomia candida]